MTSPFPDVRPLVATSAAAVADEVVSVYAAAFSGPPYEEGSAARSRFAPRWIAHAGAPGWRGMGAWADGALVGFAYGHAARPGIPWVDAVLAQLAPSTQVKWCADAFLLCELAVAPAHQGLGIGSALHDAVIEGAPHATALLTTLDDRSTTGAQLYARRGWRRLGVPYVASGYPHRYVVMGVRLDRCA